jgi:hypothetical protein
MKKYILFLTYLTLINMNNSIWAQGKGFNRTKVLFEAGTND